MQSRTACLCTNQFASHGTCSTVKRVRYITVRVCESQDLDLLTHKKCERSPSGPHRSGRSSSSGPQWWSRSCSCAWKPEVTSDETLFTLWFKDYDRWRGNLASFIQSCGSVFFVNQLVCGLFVCLCWTVPWWTLAADSLQAEPRLQASSGWRILELRWSWFALESRISPPFGSLALGNTLIFNGPFDVWILFTITVKENHICLTAKTNTGNVVHYLSVGSAGNVEELVDIGAHGVTLLRAHVQTPLQVGRVVINHRLDLLEDQVKPEVDTKWKSCVDSF